MTAAIVIADLVLVAWWIRTVRDIWHQPPERWVRGRVGRIMALVTAVVLIGTVHGLLLPWGAFLVRRPKLRNQWPSSELPMADGRPQR